MKKPPPRTEGFGSPVDVDPHHAVVDIPKARNDAVRVIERFGVRAGVNNLPEQIVRVELERPRWSAISDHVKRVFNERLKEKGLEGSRWVTGENKLDRLLGKELCVLAWAIEKAPEDLIPVALKNWIGLKPEERWWLFTMTAAATGSAEDGEIGWRKALRYALTENPVKDAFGLLPRQRRAVQQDLIPKPLPLFDR